MKSLYFFILSIILLFSCGNPSTNNGSTEIASNTAAKAPKVAYKNAEPLPSVSHELMMRLFEECDYIDYIFHDHPFSMSQDDQQSIRANLTYVSQTVNEYIPVNCKPTARMFYQIKGEIVLEADIYFSDECKFYVFVENEKPRGSNVMSEAGITFFTNAFKQAIKK